MFLGDPLEEILVKNNSKFHCKSGVCILSLVHKYKDYCDSFMLLKRCAHYTAVI